MIKLEIRDMKLKRKVELEDLNETGRQMVKYELKQMLEKLEDLK